MKKLSDEIINDSTDKERHMSFTLNQSNELFDEEAALKRHDVINIHRVSLPKKGENWEISENGRKVLILRGVRLTSKERDMLRTADGIRLIIEEYKAGNRSVAKIKAILKKHRKTL